MSDLFDGVELGAALEVFFDHTCTVEDQALNTTVAEDIPAIYGPSPANRLMAPGTFDSEASAIDSILLNAPFPAIKTGMYAKLKKDGIEKRFYIHDAIVTPVDFTLLTVAPKRKK